MQRLFILILFFLMGKAAMAQTVPSNFKEAINIHHQKAPQQSLLVYIFSPENVMEFGSGLYAETYTDSTYFQSGFLLPLSQAYFLQMQSKDRPDIWKTKVLPDLTLLDIHTHKSGYPRFPWAMDSLCNESSFNAFIRQFKPDSKKGFQVSFTALSLAEMWLRKNESSYPSTVLQAWGIAPLGNKPPTAARSAVVRQQSPLACWSYCLPCGPDAAIYASYSDLKQLLRQMLSNDIVWNTLTEPLSKTPIPNLYSGLGFQVAMNIKKLPFAMIHSSDRGNSVFIGISKNSKTGILILGDSDEAVDNLGIALMSSFHRDILKFKL